MNIDEALRRIEAAENEINGIFDTFEIDASERMEKHLISQFQDLPNIRAVLQGVGEELNELRLAFKMLATERWIDTGEGKQLDGIGEIVGRDRYLENAISLPFFGFYGQPAAKGFEQAPFRDSGQAWQATTKLADNEYRPILWAKVFKNTSHCTQEDTIAMLKTIFNTSAVVIEDMGNAKIRVGVGRELTAAELVLVKAFNLFIRAGGVGLEYAVHYNNDSYFGFLGQPKAKTFDVGTFADFIDLE